MRSTRGRGAYQKTCQCVFYLFCRKHTCETGRWYLKLPSLGLFNFVFVNGIVSLLPG